jgi:hypothetical protein
MLVELGENINIELSHEGHDQVGQPASRQSRWAKRP